MKKYYHAYDDRYKKIHTEKGKAWAGDRPSDTLRVLFEKYGADKTDKILEIGCGEGQNAIYLMKLGYNIFASNVSPEAVSWCQGMAEKEGVDKSKFFVLDALDNDLDEKFDFIYSVAVLHMLVLDEDRKVFLDFIRSHLKEGGKAIVVVMGDGENEKNDNQLDKAFELTDRPFEDEMVKVATTSCRIVNWDALKKEFARSNLKIVENYIDHTISGFPSSLVSVVE